MTYLEKLKEPEWLKRRHYIISQRKERCELCKSTKRLEVHHGCYAPGRAPWEYPDHVLWCLCRSCHEETQRKLTAIHAIIGAVHPNELGSLKEKINDASFEVTFGLTEAEANEILNEERVAESALYKNYSIEILFSNELGPSRVDEVAKLAEDRFPGIQIVTTETTGSRDCIAHVSGPDLELKKSIQSWVSRYSN